MARFDHLVHQSPNGEFGRVVWDRMAGFWPKAAEISDDQGER
ncbi:hypothetical protein [Spirillospora sp. CA-294931]